MKHYKCQFCKKKYRKLDAIKDHENTCQARVKFDDSCRLQCAVCGHRFANENCVANHVIHKHTVNGQFNCFLCGDSFGTYSDLKWHFHSHPSNSLLKCPNCRKIFPSYSVLETHCCTNLGGSPLSCNKCGISFKDYENFITDHTCIVIDGKFTCPCCCFQVKVLERFNDHFNRHFGTGHSTCSICSKTFRLRRSKEEHEKRHFMENKIICQLCGKKFKTDGDIIRHGIRVHSAKTFHCSQCPKAFSRRVFLNYHVSMVHQRKKYTFHPADPISVKANKEFTGNLEKIAGENIKVEDNKVTLPSYDNNEIAEAHGTEKVGTSKGKDEKSFKPNIETCRSISATLLQDMNNTIKKSNDMKNSTKRNNEYRCEKDCDQSKRNKTTWETHSTSENNIVFHERAAVYKPPNRPCIHVKYDGKAKIHQNQKVVLYDIKDIIKLENIEEEFTYDVSTEDLAILRNFYKQAEEYVHHSPINSVTSSNMDSSNQSCEIFDYSSPSFLMPTEQSPCKSLLSREKYSPFLPTGFPKKNIKTSVDKHFSEKATSKLQPLFCNNKCDSSDDEIVECDDANVVTVLKTPKDSIFDSSGKKGNVYEVSQGTPAGKQYTASTIATESEHCDVSSNGDEKNDNNQMFFCCRLCNTKSNTLMEHLRHEKYAHQKCPKCKRAYSCDENQHSCHIEVPLFTCQYCEEQFNSPVRLTEHRRICHEDVFNSGSLQLVETAKDLNAEEKSQENVTAEEKLNSSALLQVQCSESKCIRKGDDIHQTQLKLKSAFENSKLGNVTESHYGQQHINTITQNSGPVITLQESLLPASVLGKFGDGFINLTVALDITSCAHKKTILSYIQTSEGTSGLFVPVEYVKNVKLEESFRVGSNAGDKNTQCSTLWFDTNENNNTGDKISNVCNGNKASIGRDFVYQTAFAEPIGLNDFSLSNDIDNT